MSGARGWGVVKKLPLREWENGRLFERNLVTSH